MIATPDRRAWILRTEAARLLEVDPRTARKVLARLPVRMLRLPGMPERYHVADLKRAMEASVVTPPTS
jgi:hypothetical protein